MPHNEIEDLRKRLPKRAIAFLDADDTHPNGKYPTLMAIGRYCAQAGLTEDEFHELVEESYFAESTSLFNGTGKLSKACRRVWGKVDDGGNEYPADKQEIRRLVGDLIKQVEAHEWKRKGKKRWVSGLIDRQVALSILSHCHELGTYSPVLSVRFLAERTSRGISTVSRSLSRLADVGLVTRDGLTGQGNRRYRVDLGWRGKGHNGTSSLVPSTCSTLSLQGEVPRHDVFVPKALGPACGRIWFTMSEPGTAAQVAAAYGLVGKTARRYLDSLVDVGLASKSQARPVVYEMVNVPLERLDELATEYDTNGWLERQQATFQNSRETYEAWLRQRQRDSKPGVFQSREKAGPG